MLKFERWLMLPFSYGFRYAALPILTIRRQVPRTVPFAGLFPLTELSKITQRRVELDEISEMSAAKSLRVVEGNRCEQNSESSPSAYECRVVIYPSCSGNGGRSGCNYHRYPGRGMQQRTYPDRQRALLSVIQGVVDACLKADIVLGAVSSLCAKCGHWAGRYH